MIIEIIFLYKKLIWSIFSILFKLEHKMFCRQQPSIILFGSIKQNNYFKGKCYNKLYSGYSSLCWCCGYFQILSAEFVVRYGRSSCR